MALKPYFEQFGQGPDLVLLHGWGIHGGIFEHLYEYLEPHFRVTNIDLPGFGRSPVPNANYQVALLQEQILSVAPEQAHYVGWSLGGMLATTLALDFPERVNKLVTVASNPTFLVKDEWTYAMKVSVMENFIAMLEEDYEMTLIRFLGIQTLGSETHKEDIKRLKETVFLHGRPAGKALRGGLELLKEMEVRERLKSIEHPFLRMYGKLDGLVPVKVVEQIDALSPASRSYIFPKASHAPFLSHKESFIEVLTEFLQQEAHVA